MGACCSKKPKYEPPKKSVPTTTENMRATQQQQRQREEPQPRESDLLFNSVVPTDAPAVDCCEVDMEKCMETTMECTTYTCTHISICVMDVAADLADITSSAIQECCKEEETPPLTKPKRYINVNPNSNSNFTPHPPNGPSGGVGMTRAASKDGSVVGIGNLPLYNQVEESNDTKENALARKGRAGSVTSNMLPRASSDGSGQLNSRNSVSSLGQHAKQSETVRRNSM